MYKNLIKSLFDFCIALIFLILIFPILVIISILELLVNNGKVFFLQERIGIKGTTFKIIKFKTMNDKKDENGILLPDLQRLSPLGKIIRKISLDELPQLINVIIGDMSLIGPRPLLPEYLLLYNEFQKRRHEVKPGITGWAQVNGRNAISWGKKFDYDVWYVENISFLLDLKILFLTFKKVIKSEGISSATNVTMEKFTGN